MREAKASKPELKLGRKQKFCGTGKRNYKIYLTNKINMTLKKKRLDSNAKRLEEIYGEEDNLKKINKPKSLQINETMLKYIVLFLAVLIVAGGVYAVFFRKSEKPVETANEAKWYKVKLVDGETYYGQIKDIAADPVVIEKVYYDYDQVKKSDAAAGDKTAVEQTSGETAGNLRLVKRGKETYGPSGTMNIVRAQVVYMEPLAEDSKVLRAILEYER